MPIPVPVVKARAYWRCQAQISTELQLFGEPKALIKRSTQGCASEIAVPEVFVTAKATASGPLSAAIRRIDQVGRGTSLGAQRFAGWVRRVRLDRDQSAVLDYRLAAAARAAQRTES